MNKLNLLLIISLLLVISLGCLGGGSDAGCEGVVKFEGKTYTGKANDEKQAGLNGCNKFCLEHDPEFEAMYGIWLDSAAGKDAAAKMKHKPTKQEAIMEDKTLLDYVTLNCADRCVREANSGKHTLETSCKK